jgi:tetratricopeptide (TPR) repeat protein
MRSLAFVLPMALLVALPAYAQAPPAETGLAQMLAALKAAPGPDAATQLEERIAAAWLAEATPAVRLLLESGTSALGAHAAREAESDFGAATTLQPGLAEAWSDRALARFHAGNTAGAVADIARALTLDPNHFTALETLSYVAAARGDWQGALAAWEKLLAIDPETPGGASRLKELRRRALGQNT